VERVELVVFGGIILVAVPLLLARQPAIGRRSPRLQVAVAIVPGFLGASLALVPRSDVVSDSAEGVLLPGVAVVVVLTLLTLSFLYARRSPTWTLWRRQRGALSLADPAVPVGDPKPRPEGPMAIGGEFEGGSSASPLKGESPT
jgi:hypothetical protein